MRGGKTGKVDACSIVSSAMTFPTRKYTTTVCHLLGADAPLVHKDRLIPIYIQLFSMGYKLAMEGTYERANISLLEVEQEHRPLMTLFWTDPSVTSGDPRGAAYRGYTQY